MEIKLAIVAKKLLEEREHCSDMIALLKAAKVTGCRVSSAGSTVAISDEARVALLGHYEKRLKEIDKELEKL